MEDKVFSLKRNAILNIIKQIMSIVYPLITFPYIARTLGSEGFGIYSFSLSVSTYFILLSTLGIKNYAIRDGAKIRNDKIKINIFCNQLFTINCICVLFSFFCLVLFLIICRSVFSKYLVAILILSMAMFMDLVGTDWINSIFEDYLYITLRHICFQVISIFAMLLFVKDQNDVIIYCIISLIASHGGNFANILYIKKYVKIKLTRNMDIRRHIKPLLIFFSNIITVTIYVTADITMLGIYSNDRIVGIYSFVTRIYSLLKNIIYAIVIVSLPRLSFALNNDKEKVNKLYKEIFNFLTFVMLPIVAGLLCLSEQIILNAGGSEYTDGTISLKILSIAILFGIYSSFYSDCVLVVHGFEKKCLIATTITALCNVILNLFFIPIWGMNGAAITTLLAEALNYIIQRFFSKGIVEKKYYDFKFISGCLVGMAYIIAVYEIFKIFVKSNWNIFLIIIISAIGYFFICICFGNPIIAELCNIINRFIKNKKTND